MHQSRISNQLFRKRGSVEADRTVCESFMASVSLDVSTVPRRKEDSIQLSEAKSESLENVKLQRMDLVTWLIRICFAHGAEECE